MAAAFIKRLRRRLLVLVVTLSCLLATLAIVVQTPPAKRFLAEAVSNLVAEHTRFTLRIDGLAGMLPHKLRIATLELADAGGRVATLHGLELKLALPALMRGRILMNAVTVEHIEVWRRPMPKERFRIPRLPQLPVWPTVEMFRVDRVTLDEAVAGAPASLTVTGRLKERKTAVSLSSPFTFPEVEIEVRGLDVAGVHGVARYGFEGDAPHLMISVEDAQLLPAILQVAPPVSAQVAGHGTRADWRATLTAATGDAAVATGTLRVNEDDAVSVAADMRVHVGALPPLREYAGMLGDDVVLRVAASLDRQGTLHIDPVSLVSDTIDLALNGAANLAQSTVDWDVSLNYDDAGRLSDAFPRNEKTPLQLEASLRGAFAALEVVFTSSVGGAEMLDGTTRLDTSNIIAARGALRLTPPVILRETLPMLPEDGADIAFDVTYSEDTGALNVSSIEVSSMGVSASLRGRLAPETPALSMSAILSADDISRLAALLPAPMSGGARVEVDATGHWDDWFSTAPTAIQARIQATTEALQTTGVKPLNLALSFDLNAPTLQEMRITSLSLTDGNFTVGGTGSVHLETMTCDAQLDATAPRMAALPVDIAGLPDGELHVQARLQGGLSPLSLDVALTGQTQNTDSFLAFAGDDTSFDIGGVIAPTHIEVSALKATGGAFNADGKGIFNWREGTLQSELRATLHDLRAVGEAIGRPLSGVITVAATATGKMPNLNIAAQLEGNALTYAAGPPVQARFDIVADDVPARFEATITGQADGGGETLSLDMRAALNDNVILISPLMAAAGANRVSGQAAWSFDTGVPEAQLLVTLADLGGPAALFGLDMRGRAEAELRLQQDNGEVIAVAHNIEYGRVSLEKMESRLAFANLWDVPAGTLSVDIYNLATSPVNMSHIAVAARGDMSNIQWDATLNGVLSGGADAPHTLTCRTAGRMSVAERRIEVARLEGNLGAFPVALEAPASVGMADAGFYLTSSALRLGDGVMRAEGRLGLSPDGLSPQQDGTSLRGELRLEALPLAVSGLLLEPSITGCLDGAVVLGGTSDAPAIDASLTVSEAHLFVEAAEGFAPLDATLNARLADGRLEASFAAAMESVAAVDATGSIPALLQLRPWSLEMTSSAPLSGNVSCEVSFKPVLEALGLVEHYLDAALTGAFTVGGTLDAPVVLGDAHIRDGYYENAMAGTRLERINAHFRADGPVLRIEECAAATGNRGEVVATGELRLRTGAFAARVELKDAELARLDYLTGRVNGALAIEGGLDGALVSGDLLIGPVYASIPDQLPVSEPAALEVIEVADGKILAPAGASKSRSLPGGLSRPEITLDIHCNMPGRIYARAPILDSEWGGDLRVSGRLTEPSVEGRINVLRGHLDFLSRRFLLRDSAINFLGVMPTALWLDMRATTETPSLSAQLSLAGVLSDVRLELTSEPPLPQDEVLSHVLFGRDLSRISPVQAIQLARVAAMFNRGIAGLQLLSGNIMLPGIDRIDIRTGERADETTVGMGRYFTDSVYVEVEQGAAADSGKISVEVEVTPRVLVKGDVDAKERSGIGVFWRRDY